MKKINLNDIVKVRLKELGKYIYIHQYDNIPGLENEYLTMEKKLGKSNFVEMQMWEFMQVFGQYIYMGTNLPVGTNIYLQDEDILNVEEDGI